MEQKKRGLSVHYYDFIIILIVKSKKPIHLSKDDYIIVIEFCGINSGYHEAI